MSEFKPGLPPLIPDDFLSQEKKMVSNLVWGEATPTKDNYSEEYCCVNPNCSENGHYDANNDLHTVAVVKYDGVPRGMFDYVQVVECPQCHEQHWNHINTAGHAEELFKLKNDPDYRNENVRKNYELTLRLKGERDGD